MIGPTIISSVRRGIREFGDRGHRHIAPRKHLAARTSWPPAWRSSCVLWSLSVSIQAAQHRLHLLGHPRWQRVQLHPPDEGGDVVVGVVAAASTDRGGSGCARRPGPLPSGGCAQMAFDGPSAAFCAEGPSTLPPSLKAPRQPSCWPLRRLRPRRTAAAPAVASGVPRPSRPCATAAPHRRHLGRVPLRTACPGAQALQLHCAAPPAPPQALRQQRLLRRHRRRVGALLSPPRASCGTPIDAPLRRSTHPGRPGRCKPPMAACAPAPAGGSASIADCCGSALPLRERERAERRPKRDPLGAFSATRRVVALSSRQAATGLPSGRTSSPPPTATAHGAAGQQTPAWQPRQRPSTTRWPVNCIAARLVWTPRPAMVVLNR